MLQPISKSHHLADPIATCGDRVYVICSQNGLFTDPWGGHVPGEMWGVWDHPIKLLDGFWFGLSQQPDDLPQWLLEADECRACVGFTEFDYRFDRYRVTRRDFVPDGNEGVIVTLTLRFDAPPATPPTPPDGWVDREPLVDEPPAATLTLHALFRSDLRPAWLGDQAGMSDGQDMARVETDRCVFTDAQNTWACVVGSDAVPTQIMTGDKLWAVQPTSGKGTSAQLTFTQRFGLDGTTVITFLIAGSATSEAEASATFHRLKAERDQFVEAKVTHYQSIVAASRVITPDATLNEAMAWSKLVSQMLARSVPQYGTGTGAGLPEYPWWFGIDTAYAVLPMLQSGQFELAHETLRLLQRWSQEHNADEPGRVLHEMSTTGVVFNKGNMVEVPAFTRAVHQYWLWTGDRTFLDEMYPFCKQGMLDYALARNDPDGDLCPTGRSIIETPEMHAGFEVMDVAAYTWEALIRLTDMAHIVGDEVIVPEVQHKAGQLADLIRHEWWLDDEGLFADVRASVNQVHAQLDHLASAARQQGWPSEVTRQVVTAHRRFEPYLSRYRDRPRATDLPWLLRHWVVMCPLEVGLATPHQAERALRRLQSDEFCDEWGMYLHPEQHDVMSINTGILALCAARYGQVDDALGIVHKLTRAFSYRTPGAVCEALPDKWCFLQLWSNAGLVAPAVECFLGIAPRAGGRRLRITPQLPAAWDWIEVQRLRVGDASIDVRVAREDNTTSLSIAGAVGWSVQAGLILPRNAAPKAVRLNGQPVSWRIEQTLAGDCLICDAQGDVHLAVDIQPHA